MSKLLKKRTVDYIDDEGRLWRFHLSAFNVIARGMYEQLYLQTARDWYMSAVDKKPEDVINSHKERLDKKEDITRDQLYLYWLAERSYAWAMALASLDEIEMQTSPVITPPEPEEEEVEGSEETDGNEDVKKKGKKAPKEEPVIPPPTMEAIPIPEEWKTPNGMMESMDAELFSELTFQAYKLNPQVLMPQTDEEKKRGVVRVS